MDPNLETLLQTHQIRFVRVVWCDNAGLVRAKAVHAQAAVRFVAHGVGITPAMQAVTLLADTPIAASGLGPVGEVRLVPDWDTFTPLPYAPGHARVVGDMRLDGQPWAVCPRHFLRRMAAEAARDGLALQAAFENEFYLLRPTPDGFAAADDTVFAATWSMDQHRAVIDDFAEALLAQGIPVESYYPESGPGQQELSIRHADALTAADRQVAYRETARAVALRHGLRACFLPKVYPNHAGSGAHLHLSLWAGERNLLPDPQGAGGLSAVGRAFVAGLLEHLPALMAVTTPSVNSYRRLLPGCWSGAYRVWGVDNREAAVRVPSDPAGRGSTHVELKTVDATCNPYLALGAVLAAGLDGVRRRLELAPPVQADPAALTDAERHERHIERLPANLGQALEYLNHDPLLTDALGAPLSRAFTAVRCAEWQALADLDLDEEVKRLWERY